MAASKTNRHEIDTNRHETIDTHNIAFGYRGVQIFTSISCSASIFVRHASSRAGVSMSPPWRTCALHAQRGAVLSITPSSGKQAFPFTVENECSPLPPPVENRRFPLPVENG